MKDTLLFGILKPGEKIQPIRELATSLGINPNTVKKAYEELENIGAIVTISTKGTFVADNTKNVLNKKIEEKVEQRKLREEIHKDKQAMMERLKDIMGGNEIFTKDEINDYVLNGIKPKKNKKEDNKQ